jgi:hypothetical protein
MPIEVEQLRYAPYAIESCKQCGEQYPEFMRGQVQSVWRKFFFLPYCAVICHKCKQIIGWEKP